MAISLLSFNVLILLCTWLGILMFNNKLKQISNSVDIYLDPKAYKPESQMRFISALVDKYTSYDDKSSVDLDLLIRDDFYHHKIGNFSTQAVETLAQRGKSLLWIGIISMLVIGVNPRFTIISAGLAISLAFFELYMDIERGKQRLFLKLKNHLSNEYPQLKLNEKQNEEVSLLLSKIEKLESEIQDHEQVEPAETQEDTLQAEDIAQILRQFDMSQL